MKKYAWKNVSFETMSCERWKSLPGLEGYYSISNLGRARRETHEIVYKDGRSFMTKEKIIKPRIVQTENKFKKEFQRYLVNRVTVKGIRYNLMIARFVYHCFVTPFDLEDNAIAIFQHDQDTLNLDAKNLYAATIQVKQKRMVTRKWDITDI